MLQLNEQAPLQYKMNLHMFHKNNCSDPKSLMWPYQTITNVDLTKQKMHPFESTLFTLHSLCSKSETIKLSIK